MGGRRRSGLEKFLTALVLCILVLGAIAMLVPLFYLVCSAFKTNEDVFSSTFLPPGEGLFGVAWNRLTVDNFVRLFRQLDFARHILNSTFLASVTSVLATLCSAMGGYALSKFRFRGREFLTNFILAALVIPAALLIAPTYQLLYWMGLIDSHAGLILPGIAPAFGVYLFRQAMINSVPSEILDSARIDGCGEIRIFFKIVLPLVRPMIGAFC